MMNNAHLAFKLIRILTAFGFIFFSNPAAAKINLAFGVYATDKPTVVVKKFKPLLKTLEKSLEKHLDQPVRIKLQVASTYAAGIADIASGRVDFARLGPASYVEAKNREQGLGILALEAKNGEKRFNGVICVSIDSTIKNAADLKGKRFAFGDRRSTIGRYLSQQYLLEQGLRARDLREYDYLERHDKVGSAVAVGQFDAGALKESTFKRLVKQGAALRVLATFPNVTKPWISRAGLNEDIAGALQASLLEIKNPKVLKALKKDGFVQGSDDDYIMIRHAIQRNSHFFNE